MQVCTWWGTGVVSAQRTAFGSWFSPATLWDLGLLGLAARSPTCRYTILTRYTLPFPASFYEKTKSHDLRHFFCFSAKSKQGLHIGALQKYFNKVMMNHFHL